MHVCPHTLAHFFLRTVVAIDGDHVVAILMDDVAWRGWQGMSSNLSNCLSERLPKHVKQPLQLSERARANRSFAP